MTRPKALIAWSSGEDSAWVLHEARRQAEFDIVGALTTVTDSFARVSMHGVREAILQAQLAAAGLPSIVVRIPYPCPNEVYEARMAEALAAAKTNGISAIIFGDLFLEDIRAYRVAKLAGGLKIYLTTVDLKKLPTSFAGRKFDQALLADFPPGIDPCGENCEFYSCVVARPMFSRRIEVSVGPTVDRDRFAYADFLLA